MLYQLSAFDSSHCWSDEGWAPVVAVPADAAALALEGC